MICDFCVEELEEMSTGSGNIMIKECVNKKDYKYVTSISNACPRCLDNILLYKEERRVCYD